MKKWRRGMKKQRQFWISYRVKIVKERLLTDTSENEPKCPVNFLVEYIYEIRDKYLLLELFFTKALQRPLLSLCGQKIQILGQVLSTVAPF